MKWYRVLPVLAMITLAACQPPKPKDPAAANSPDAAADPSLAASVAVPEYNLGDVEVATIPELYLSERSRSSKIQYVEMRNPLRKELTLATATVPQPLPSEFWVTAMIGSPRGFRDTDAVLALLTVTVDTQKEPIAKKAYVFSGKNLGKHPELVEVDLAPFLKPLPETVLVLARVRIVWFPNTDPKTVTSEMVDDPKGQTVEKLSNPLRIDFK